MDVSSRKLILQGDNGLLNVITDRVSYGMGVP